MCGLTGFLSANNNHDFINHTVRRMTSALTHRGPDAGAVWMDEEVGDSAYIIGDTGTIVPVGDMRALADGVLELLALPAGERISATASPVSGKSFSRSDMSPEHMSNLQSDDVRHSRNIH